MTLHRAYAGIASVIVLTALVWGFFVVGSPLSERARKFDERRITDLRLIHSAILDVVHAGRPNWVNDLVPRLQEPLPVTLEDVAASASYERLSIVDPETGAPYAYRITGESTYDLCADFRTVRDTPFDIAWNHPAGTHCFRFDALKTDGFGTNPREVKPVPPSVP